MLKGNGLMRREASLRQFGGIGDQTESQFGGRGVGDPIGRQFGGGGGCTDPFSVFTFLAFALAVMDLVMEMNRCFLSTTHYQIRHFSF